MRRFLLLLAILFVCAEPLYAQLDVTMDIKRHFFMLYEPIVATVTVKNLSGRDITLADSPTQSWFGFQINRGDGGLVPPLNPDYRLEPLTIPMGQTVKRSVILNTLFPVHELGLYRVRAAIYFSAMDKYFQSRMTTLELSEGKTVWQKVLGVPDGKSDSGGTRNFSLLVFRQAEYSMLYVRVEDPNAGMVYATMALGKLISGMEPEVEIDTQNNLHVLQVSGMKTYLYSRVSLNGELVAHDNYYSTTTRPTLRRTPAGMVTVVGGSTQSEAGDPNRSKMANKLSDRPVELPK